MSRKPKPQQNDKRENNKFSPSTTNLVSARNVFTIMSDSEETGDDLLVMPLAVLHYGMQFDDMIRNDAMLNNEAMLSNVIAKHAANYFTVVDATTVSGIRSAIIETLIASAEYIALVFSYHKYTNCSELVDEYSNPVGRYVRCLSNLWDNIGGYTGDAVAFDGYDFGMSNSEYKRRVLSGLSETFISHNALNFMQVFINHFIKFRAEDDSTARIVTIDWADENYSLRTVANTKDSFVSELEDKLTSIRTAVNTYTFLPALIEEIIGCKRGLAATLDLTRDLKQKTFNLIYDKDDSFYNLFYSASHYYDLWSAISDSTIGRRITTDLTVPSGDFVDCGEYNGDMFKYTREVMLDINSLQNVMRTNLIPANATVMYKDVPSVTFGAYVINPVYVDLSDRNFVLQESMTNDVYGRQGYANLLLSMIDLPTFGVTIRPTDYVAPAEGEYQFIGTIPSAYFVLRTGAKCYLLAEQDVDSVISDAEYNLWFNNYNVNAPFSSKDKINQTLGNNGTNSSN